ncbi:MAG: sugar ABC transporter permease [Oscillospiraceae bacterium]|nr:sugar ABC transporter permease [Oscillospiraceae bacterium]
MASRTAEKTWESRKRELGLSLYEGRRRISQALFGRIKPGRQLKAQTKRNIFVWAMLALPLLNLLVFWLYVNIDSILMAFRNVDYANGGVEYWTLDNFKTIYKMFTEQNQGADMLLYGANTLKYWLLGTVWSIPHSILLTYVFHKKLRGTKFFRVVLYLPSIICSVVLAGIFEAFISGKGVFGKLLMDVFHVARVPAWFQEAEYATPMLLFYSFFFGFAGSYILFSGAMARIPKEVMEAAALDGVTMWQELWHIIIPLMWPTLSMTIVTSFAGIFGASGSILLFTPYMESTFTFGYWIFDQVRRYNAYYLPSALGLIFTLIAYPLCLLLRKLVTSIYADVD